MGGSERINAFIRENGFSFEVAESDIDNGFHTITDREQRKIWYRGMRVSDDVLVFQFKQWNDPDKAFKFTTKDEESLTVKEFRQVNKFNKELEIERGRKQMQARLQVDELWQRWSLGPRPLSCDYLEGKKLNTPAGVICRSGEEDAQRILVVPMFDEEGVMWNFQQIFRSGKKAYHPKARAKGLYHKIPGSADVVLLGEGFATCLATWQATGFETYCAFSVSNLELVLRTVLKKHPAAKIMLLADWDGETFQRTGENPGMLMAQKLALKYMVKVAVPSGAAGKNVDFADLTTEKIVAALEDACGYERLAQCIYKEKRKKRAQSFAETLKTDVIETLVAQDAPTIPPDAKLREVSPIRFAQTDGKAFAPVTPVEIPSKEQGFMDVKLGRGNAVYYTPKYTDLAQYLRQTHHLKANDAFLYMYRDHFYQRVSALQLKSIVTDLVRVDTDPKDINKFCDAAKAKNFVERSALVEPPGFINLANGVLDVRNRELLAHSPEYFFKYRLRHEYLEGATCPNWIAFLQRTFEGNEALVNVSAEIFGYVLIGGYPFLHKAFALLGEGRNGKSTWLDMLKYLLGSANFSAVPVGKFDKPFSVVMLDGMLANIVGETSTREIDSESFKTAVGGEELIASQKGQPEYPLKVRARLIFACNRFPHLGDATTGAHEKFFILPFNRYLQANERDPLFAQKFLYPEVCGVLNWALDGLERLVRRGGFPEVDAVKEQAVELREEIDSVFAWFREHVDLSPIGAVPHQQRVIFKNFYGNYQRWCRNEGRAFVSKSNFGKRIAAEMRKHPHCLTNYSGRVLTVIAGVKISLEPAPVLDLEY